MADVQQDATGRWKIKVKLTNASPDITISGVTFDYNGSAVTFNITKTMGEVETPWVTRVGEDLDPTKLTKNYPTFTIGNTRYVPGQDSITTVPYNE